MPTDSSTLRTVTVRPFRPEDSEQILRLFLTGMINGSGSPYRFALRRIFIQWKLMYFMYSAFVSGAGVALGCKGSARYLGMSLVVGVSTFMFYVYRKIYSAFTNYCDNALQTDLADISHHYRPNLSLEEKGARPAVSGFWVAEMPSTTAKNGFEIVGCVGLDGSTSEDPTESELRRMMVSPSHRQHGIATKLVRTLVEHAKECHLSSLYLGTSSLQPAAMQMYARLGWNKAEMKETESAAGQKAVFITYRLSLSEET